MNMTPPSATFLQWRPIASPFPLDPVIVLVILPVILLKNILLVEQQLKSWFSFTVSFSEKGMREEIHPRSLSFFLSCFWYVFSRDSSFFSDSLKREDTDRSPISFSLNLCSCQRYLSLVLLLHLDFLVVSREILIIISRSAGGRSSSSHSRLHLSLLYFRKNLYTYQLVFLPWRKKRDYKKNKDRSEVSWLFLILHIYFV